MAVKFWIESLSPTLGEILIVTPRHTHRFMQDPSLEHFLEAFDILILMESLKRYQQSLTRTFGSLLSMLYALSAGFQLSWNFPES